MIPRHAQQQVEVALGRQAAVALVGPRQVGKTTLAIAVADKVDSIYLDLESPADRARLASPTMFLEEYEHCLVVLDEIHRFPGLFPELRGVIDAGRRAGRRTGRFLILGSASLDLLRQAGESLAGRIEYVPLGTLDVLDVSSEVASRTRHWLRGGFPDSLLARSDEDSLAYRSNLIRTYLDRDITEFTGQVLPAQTLSRLWTMLAHGQGTILNASRLAASLDVSAPTVKRYTDLLVDLLLVRRLPPYFTNVRKRLVKAPKVYVRDAGLVHALLGIADHNALLGHPVAGASWEGFVMDSLVNVAPLGTVASFYGTRAGAEIDLILEIPGESAPWAVEIKLGLVPKPTRGFYNALEDVQPSQAFIVYSGEDRYPISRDVHAIGLQEMAERLAHR